MWNCIWQKKKNTHWMLVNSCEIPDITNFHSLTTGCMHTKHWFKAFAHAIYYFIILLVIHYPMLQFFFFFCHADCSSPKIAPRGKVNSWIVSDASLCKYRHGQFYNIEITMRKTEARGINRISSQLFRRNDRQKAMLIWQSIHWGENPKRWQIHAG